MKIVNKQVTKVVETTLSLGLDTKREAEAFRASLSMRREHIKAELEKPLAAGVAAVLREELRILINGIEHTEYIKEHLQK